MECDPCTHLQYKIFTAETTKRVRLAISLQKRVGELINPSSGGHFSFAYTEIYSELC